MSNQTATAHTTTTPSTPTITTATSTISATTTTVSNNAAFSPSDPANNDPAQGFLADSIETVDSSYEGELTTVDGARNSGVGFAPPPHQQQEQQQEQQQQEQPRGLWKSRHYSLSLSDSVNISESATRSPMNSGMDTLQDGGNKNTTKKRNRLFRGEMKRAVTRVKTFMVSKISDTFLGRQAILFALGERGSDMILSIQHSAAIEIGDKKARKLTTYIVQLAYRGKLLHDEHKLTNVEHAGLAEPINTVTVLFLHRLQLSCRFLGTSDPESAANMESLDIPTLVEQFQPIYKSIMCLLERLESPSFLRKFETVYSSYCSQAFLQRFLLSNETSKYKLTCLRHLQALVAERLTSADGKYALQCLELECSAEVAQEAGQFGGSIYCPHHHAAVYQLLISSPDPLHLVLTKKDEKVWDSLRSTMEEAFGMPRVMLYRAVHNYKACDEGIRHVFAGAIFEKYVSDEKMCSHFVDGIPDDIRDDLAITIKDPTVLIFDPLIRLLAEVFTKVFGGDVCQDKYEEYLTKNLLVYNTETQEYMAPL